MAHPIDANPTDPYQLPGESPASARYRRSLEVLEAAGAELHVVVAEARLAALVSAEELDTSVGTVLKQASAGHHRTAMRRAVRGEVWDPARALDDVRRRTVRCVAETQRIQRLLDEHYASATAHSRVRQPHDAERADAASAVETPSIETQSAGAEVFLIPPARTHTRPEADPDHSTETTSARLITASAVNRRSQVRESAGQPERFSSSLSRRTDARPDSVPSMSITPTATGERFALSPVRGNGAPSDHPARGEHTGYVDAVDEKALLDARLRVSFLAPLVQRLIDPETKRPYTPNQLARVWRALIAGDPVPPNTPLTLPEATPAQLERYRNLCGRSLRDWRKRIILAQQEARALNKAPRAETYILAHQYPRGRTSKRREDWRKLIEKRLDREQYPDAPVVTGATIARELGIGVRTVQAIIRSLVCFAEFR